MGDDTTVRSKKKITMLDSSLLCDSARRAGVVNLYGYFYIKMHKLVRSVINIRFIFIYAYSADKSNKLY